MNTLAMPAMELQALRSLDAALIFLLVVAIMRILVDFIDVVTRLAESVATGGLGLILVFAAAAAVVTAVAVVVIQLS
jgi:hypothetical protein